MLYIKSYLLLDLDLSLLCKYALIIIKNIRFYILVSKKNHICTLTCVNYETGRYIPSSSFII